MIRRLTQLSLKNFRLFRGERHISLDGDVVLIFGANGAGKSSILSAIEFGLTGSVPDLMRYGQDYPRCLRHVRAEGVAEVRVTFNSDQSPPLTVASNLSESDVVEHQREFMDDSARRFFSERCYLSQVRLGRLLDMYQAVERGSADPPIVQFVRRLLRLESLETLREALHDIEDVRRARKAYPDVSFLEEEEKRIATLKAELTANIQTLAASRSTTVNAIQQLISPIDGTVKVSELDLGGIDQLITRLASTIEELQKGPLGAAEKDAQALRELRIIIEASEGPADSRLLGLQQDLTNLETIQHDLLQQLRPIVDAATLALPDLDLPDESSDPSTFGDRWSRASLHVSQSLAKLRTEHQAALEEAKRLTSLQAARSEKQDQLTTLQSEISRLTSAVPQWAESLASIASGIVDDECPVCLRDFSELGKGPLRDFVQQRATQIGLDAKRLQECEAARAQLVPQIADVDRETEALVMRANARGPSTETAARVDALAALSQRFESNRSQLDAWIDSANRAVQLRSEIRISQSRIRHLADAQVALTAIAQRLGITAPHTNALGELLPVLEQKCLNTVQLQSKAIEEIRSVRERLRELTSLLNDVDKLDRQWLDLNNRELRAMFARKKMDITIEKSRIVLKCAITAKRKLLDRVFDETLNHLWSELFERLVRNEIFKPRLSDSKSSRDQIRATMQAVADGVEPFQNVGAVHSLGNQNTSALSLFLALNLIEAPRHRVLILDDPVQSMDDVHVSQFAMLLREILNQAGRQIFVAVHERPLFEYLAFELSPTVVGRKLVLIELDRVADGLDCVVKTETREWTSDNVPLELAARAS